MELTDELKEKLLKCETREQADELLDKAGIHFSDNELDAIAGGSIRDGDIRLSLERRKIESQLGIKPKFY